MNREVHVRVWERAEVKFLRATRQNRRLPRRSIHGRFTSMTRGTSTPANLPLGHPNHQTTSCNPDHAARSLPQLFYADARLSVRVMVLLLTCWAACVAPGMKRSPISSPNHRPVALLARRRLIACMR
jgi:hypothetical protein